MSLIKKHALFKHYDVTSQLSKPLKDVGIEGFIYIQHFADGSFVDLSNQLKWSEYFLENYLNEKYNPADIVDHMFLHEGISLWAANPNNVIWQEGAQHFDFGNGISIAKSSGQEKALACFYSSYNNHKINEFYVNNINLLKSYIEYFEEQVHSIIQASDRLVTPQRYLGDSASRDSSKFEAESRVLFRNGKIIKVKTQELNLTNREIECIRLCAKGFSAKMIARQLNVSPRTVESHINSAKEKLNCRNVSELVCIVARETDLL